MCDARACQRAPCAAAAPHPVRLLLHGVFDDAQHRLPALLQAGGELARALGVTRRVKTLARRAVVAERGVQRTYAHGEALGLGQTHTQTVGVLLHDRVRRGVA